MPEIPKPWEGSAPEVPQPDTGPDIPALPGSTDLSSLAGLGGSSLAGSVEVPDELRPDITRPPTAAADGVERPSEPTEPTCHRELADTTAEQEAGPASDASDPPDQPPPIDLPGSAEFPSPETVLDMPAEERERAMATLEQFVAGGVPYARDQYVADDEGGHVETTTGYQRDVPSGLLGPNQGGYEVKVTSKNASDRHPYGIEVTAIRTVTREVNLTGVDGPYTAEVDGVEMKSFSLTPASGAVGEPDAPPVEMQAGSVLLGPRHGDIVEQPIFDDSGEVIAAVGMVPFGLDTQAPLLRLDEARSIVEAIGQANELPDQNQETDTSSHYTPPYPEARHTEFSESSEPGPNVSNTRRQQFINQIDEFARNTPHAQSGEMVYEEQIPHYITQEHGIAGVVRAVVMDMGSGVSRYGLMAEEAISGVVPGFEFAGELPGMRRTLLGFSESYEPGTRAAEGGGQSGAPIDLRYACQETYWLDENARMFGDSREAIHQQDGPDFDFETARNLYNALHQANLTRPW